MYDSVWALSTMGGHYGPLATRAVLGGANGGGGGGGGPLVPSPPPTSEPSPPVGAMPQVPVPLFGASFFMIDIPLISVSF
jgi:hypothetical protein